MLVVVAYFSGCIFQGIWDGVRMGQPKYPRFKRKRDDAEKAAEAGLKTGQDVAALIIARADPKPPAKRKP